MNVKFLPLMPAINEWLKEATTKLTIAQIPSARLDAEIILAHILNKDRTYLHGHSEHLISDHHLKVAESILELRLKRVPIAYLMGFKEFYGRNFSVTTATLIPRPESENIITILGQLLESVDYKLSTKKLVDIGTGSGCLGITAKLEFPELDVTLVDISDEALKVATFNATNLSASVDALQSNLLQNYPSKVDIILANLPYVDKIWERSPETDYEPSLALFADKNGMELIEKLINQLDRFLNPSGYVIIEADPTQHEQIIEHAHKKSLILVEKIDFILAFKYQC